ncbi:MAG TPA: hypothetical protein VJU86_07375 [Pyrinomonadaceae bacterium]|nr:hypothetical protein [Pyrinomonadaceae bacterium]
MSEVKLNLVDTQEILTGTIHGSVVDSCVAALSAEPETIAELRTALGRYIKPQEDHSPFSWFRRDFEIDQQPWDAGLVIIDLASRIVAAESSYSQPGPEGEVNYHDGTQSTDIEILYRVPGDWLFVNSVEAYRWSSKRRRRQRERNPPLDIRAVLYGPPLLEYIVDSGIDKLGPMPERDDEEAGRAIAEKVSAIHADWLMTSLAELRGRSPREVILEKRELIDFDLHTRCLQWTFQGEGPPCLPPDSFAFKFAGFGTHEWVVYYELVRHLLWSALDYRESVGDCANKSRESFIAFLEKTKSDWLEQPQGEYDGKVPANIIDNERKRLPQAMSSAEIIIDDDCELCRWAALEAEMGLGPTFWHLDGCNMDDGFAFSTCITAEEWEAELRQREEFDRECERRREERNQRIARGEKVEDEFGFEWLDASSEQPKPDPDFPF